MEHKKIEFTPELQAKTGPLDYKLTNDYLFRIVLQEDEVALRGLLCALLNLREEDIGTIEIKNPIVVGAAIEEKEYRMDIRVALEHGELIDIEMQVKNNYDWPNRSLAYLCRQYDSLTRGDNYANIPPAYHISILDFTLFPEHPEFYATYQMMNKKTGHLYNSNFTLSVLELNQVERATDEDIESGLVKWAQIFKATTWEELRMIAEKNESMISTANSILQYESEEAVRMRMRDREDYIARQKRTAELEKLLEEKDKKIAELEEYIHSHIESNE